NRLLQLRADLFGQCVDVSGRRDQVIADGENRATRSRSKLFRRLKRCGHIKGIEPGNRLCTEIRDRSRLESQGARVGLAARANKTGCLIERAQLRGTLL